MTSFFLAGAQAQVQGSPNSTTICRFRNRLVSAKLDEVLLAEVNRQLAALGLKVNEARGAIIDASIIQAAARPNRTVQVSAKGKDRASARSSGNSI